MNIALTQPCGLIYKTVKDYPFIHVSRKQAMISSRHICASGNLLVSARASKLSSINKQVALMQLKILSIVGRSGFSDSLGILSSSMQQGRKETTSVASWSV